MAPPSPCRTRIAQSIGRVVLTAHSPEATVNSTIASMKIRLPPNRSASQPLTGMPTATVTR
jgi:hypothetical protein